MILRLIPTAWTPQPWQAVVLSLLIILLVPSEFIYRRNDKAGPSQDRHSGRLLAISSLVNLAVIVWAVRSGFGRITWHPEWVADLGLLITATGVFLRYWSIATLGRFFTSIVLIQDGQRVIRRGPFRWVRHPSYGGALLFGSGCALACGNGFGAVFYLLVHGAAFWYRSKVEEMALQAHFGDEYRQYRAETWRFFPLIPG